MQAVFRGDEARSSQLANSDANLCPPDYGYLSSGQLQEDSERRQATLDCFKKVRLEKNETDVFVKRRPLTPIVGPAFNYGNRPWATGLLPLRVLRRVRPEIMDCP